MGAHRLEPHVCPICRKRFDRAHKLETHQKRLRHTQWWRDDAYAQMKRYHHDKTAGKGR